MVAIISLFQLLKTDTKKLGAMCTMGEEGRKEAGSRPLPKDATLRTVHKLRSQMVSKASPSSSQML